MSSLGGLYWDAQDREQEDIQFLGALFSSVFQFTPCPLALGTALAWLKFYTFKTVEKFPAKPKNTDVFQ